MGAALPIDQGDMLKGPMDRGDHFVVYSGRAQRQETRDFREEMELFF